MVSDSRWYTICKMFRLWILARFIHPFTTLGSIKLVTNFLQNKTPTVLHWVKHLTGAYNICYSAPECLVVIKAVFSTACQDPLRNVVLQNFIISLLHSLLFSILSQIQCISGKQISILSSVLDMIYVIIEMELYNNA